MAKEKLTPEEILSELAEGNEEKAKKIDAEVEKIISAVSGLCAHNFMHMACNISSHKWYICKR